MSFDKTCDYPDWRKQLEKAISANNHLKSWHFLQLATTDEKNHPSNRTMVFRCFQRETHHLVMVTDMTSSKVTHVLKQPIGEICWYFHESWEQFRITGKLSTVGSRNKDKKLESLRNQIWKSLSNATQSSFYIDLTHSDTLPPENRLDNLPPDNFGLLMMKPTQIKHLRLDITPHQKRLFVLEG